MMIDGTLYVSGDWHGQFDQVIKSFKLNDIRNCSIIQVGDFGIGFSTYKKDINILNHFNNTLKARNIHLYVIRGNHDNPKWFNGQTIGNISFLEDYSILEWQDKKILCAGGAVSIDRLEHGNVWKGRKEGRDWWPDEVFKYDQSKLEQSQIVITHSCPDFCQPLVKSNIEKWFQSDPNLKLDCQTERQLHTQLYTDLSKLGHIEKWYYGHYHYSNTEWINDTRFQLLNIYEIVEIR